MRRSWFGPFTPLPHRGRPGKKETTRELVLSPMPYIVVYRVSGDAIHVLRILRGAQNMALEGRFLERGTQEQNRKVLTYDLETQ
jgi:hypothetical protein